MCLCNLGEKMDAVYSMTREILEDNFDGVKVIILAALVQDGLVAQDDAEKWCKQHTLILRKKPFFYTLSDKRRKTEIDDKPICIVVAQV